MKLSILVTFCNQKEYIRESLDSIYSQKVNFEYEVLIGLDGKDDGSESIINEYLSKYPNTKLFKIDNSELNTINIEKASINRLNLINNAHGEYLSFLDGDDFYTSPVRFQKLVDILDKHHECIAALHDYTVYDHVTREYSPLSFLSDTETILSVAEYMQQNHKQFSCFMFRNIFYSNIPTDLNTSFINDSTLICYFLKYGNLYYIPEQMFAYRVNIPSIYSSRLPIIKFLYSLLCGEINSQTLPQYQELICKRYKRYLRKVIKAYIRNRKEWINLPEVLLIKQFSLQTNCYFSKSILTFTSLSLIKKLELIKNIILMLFFNKYPMKFKVKDFFYFNNRPNFGDELNLYILQRVLKIYVYKSNKKRHQLFAIGSILQNLLKKKFSLPLRHPTTIWGSGFIQSDNKKFIKKPLKVLALRGYVSKQRLEKLLNHSLNNIALGDPGLLSHKLIDTSKITKKYKVGIIAHYIDANEDFLNNIHLTDYTVLDITQNPITLLHQIAECEVILSSAMHGLIAADSLNIPNCWIKISDNLEGVDYKFNDYYSVFNCKRPEPIDLRLQIINDDIIQNIIENYPKDEIKSQIDIINKNLLSAASKI